MLFHGVPFLALANKSLPGPAMFDDSGANTSIWTWGAHGPDWIYQGGPSQDDGMIKDPFFNEWGTLDDSLAPFQHVTMPVDPTEVDGWLGSVGQGIY